MWILTEDAVKARLATRAVAVPKGAVVREAAGIDDALAVTGVPVMVKALVPLADRKRRGLVIRCGDRHDAEAAVRSLLGSTADGHLVEEVYVEALAPDGEEHYLGIGFDHVAGRPVLLHGPGGSGVEHRAAPTRHLFDLGAQPPLSALEPALHPVVTAMAAEFEDLRAHLVELNPVRVDDAGRAIVLDGKATLEPDLPPPPDARRGKPEDPAGRRLADYAAGLPGGAEVRFGRLDGDVGIISAGGGVLAVLLDSFGRHGLRPANFADVSGGQGTTQLLAAVAAEVLELSPRGVVFATGIMSSIDVTTVAESLVAAISPFLADGRRVPIVARLAGPGEERAAEVLRRLPDTTVLGRSGTVQDAVDVLAGQLAPTSGAVAR